MVIVGVASEESSGITVFSKYFAQHHHFTLIDLREVESLTEDYFKDLLKEGFHKHYLVFPIQEVSHFSLLS